LLLVTSNIRLFVEEECELGHGYRVECKKLNGRCKGWHDSHKLRYGLGSNHLSARLTDLFPQIGTDRPGDKDNQKRPWYFTGIRLRRDWVEELKPHAPQPQAAANVIPMEPKLRRI
jgi:hypothetical protein